MSNILDKFNMDGKVSVVTGGAGLLGKQFSLTLAQAGSRVVVADIDENLAQTVSDKLVEEGFEAIPVGVDVTDPASVKDMVQKCLQTYERLDVLVCSAAMDPKFDSDHEGSHGNSFEDYPVEAWRQALDVNLTGMFLCAQAAVIPMLEQNQGSIINICSTYGLVGPDQRIYHQEGKPAQFKPVFYSVTKSGVLGLTKYLATYYAGKNIRANALTPGGVYNDHGEPFLSNYTARTVMGRMADQDEMNGGLLFLASDASTYMTGSNLVVDGGWTAW
ncbi:MAG: SDR family oxidoreductase [Anaerolineaceae bacterium]|nr:SDR family oxidoreductase [Anaerolineaceae bacterium]